MSARRITRNRALEVAEDFFEGFFEGVNGWSAATPEDGHDPFARLMRRMRAAEARGPGADDSHSHFEKKVLVCATEDADRIQYAIGDVIDETMHKGMHDPKLRRMLGPDNFLDSKPVEVAGMEVHARPLGDGKSEIEVIVGSHLRRLLAEYCTEQEQHRGPDL